jgi:drug/metabolite transporter (DMT)-like permease
MEPTVFMAVLAAAAMHAGWNAFLKVRLDPLLAMTLITACAGVLTFPLLFVFGFPRLESWPWLTASLILHLLYYGTLTEAYRRADMSQIYPIARGGAPLLTAGAALYFLREPVGFQAGIGIAVLGGGIMLIALANRAKKFDPVAIGFALLTAVVISGYTITDGIGARVAGDPHAYSVALFVVDSVPLLIFVIWRGGLKAVEPMRAFLPQGFLGAAMSIGAYWIAIWAMTVAPIALVAALRETSVLFATLIAVFILKEPFVPARGIAAALIVLGILLIRLQ